MWSVTNETPTYHTAVYFLILQSENVVLHTSELNIYTTPMEHIGDFSSFVNMHGQETPLIPLDTHSALSIGWVTMDRMVRNRPYLDETIKAAIALVA